MNRFIFVIFMFSVSMLKAATPTPTWSPTTSPTPTFTLTTTPTPTFTATQTSTPTFTATPTASPTPTYTRTPQTMAQIMAGMDSHNVVIELSNNEIIRGAFTFNTDTFEMNGFTYPLTYVRKFKQY